MSRETFRAIARTIIPTYEGGDGRTLGDWMSFGHEHATRDEAWTALSTARAKGWQTRIVQCRPDAEPRVMYTSPAPHGTNPDRLGDVEGS